MRIQFTKFIPVDLSLLQPTAWGQVTFEIISQPPTFHPDGTITQPTAERLRGFRSGAIVDLPDDVAMIHITAGEAEPHESPRGPVIHSETEQVIS